MKRTDLAGAPVRTFLDQRLDWMKRYSVLRDDDPRWTLSVIVFSTDGKIRKHARHVMPLQAHQIVKDCLESIAEDSC